MLRCYYLGSNRGGRLGLSGPSHNDLTWPMPAIRTFSVALHSPALSHKPQENVLIVVPFVEEEVIVYRKFMTSKNEQKNVSIIYKYLQVFYLKISFNIIFRLYQSQVQTKYLMFIMLKFQAYIMRVELFLYELFNIFI